jgi:DeoR family suf operon transcriptional repressor
LFGTKSGTKGEILEVLRTQNEVSIKHLSNAIGVSTSTLNEHLADLQAENLVDKQSDREGPGRPRHLYFLTENAEKLFPHSYSGLSSDLLKIALNLTDKENLKQKLTKYVKQDLEKYDDLESALSSMGFYPEMQDTDPESGQTITFHQCPFYEVAQENPILCEVDEAVLSEVTQKSVQKECCIADGAEKCEFQLTPS